MPLQKNNQTWQTAQAKADQATKDVKTAEQAVASAQSALDGTGLTSAQKRFDTSSNRCQRRNKSR